MKAMISTIFAASLFTAIVTNAANPTPAQAPTAKPEASASEKLLVEILKKATTNIYLDLTFRSGNQSCAINQGGKIGAAIMLGEKINFDFAKADQDPMYAMVLQAAEAGLTVQAELIADANCKYKVNVKFYKINLETGKSEESNLQLSLRMGLTGELLAFRVHNLVASLEEITKGETKSFEFIGSLKADQKMSDFGKVALKLKSAKVNESQVVAWYPADIKIIYQNGELIIPIKSSAVPGLGLPQPPTPPAAKLK